MLSAVALGFALGLRHALDPDHVAAVSAIAARQRSPWRAPWIGAVWGAGHGAAILALGAAVVALRFEIPDALLRGAELGVGGLLVALGAANLGGAPGPGPSATAAGRPPRSALARSGGVGLAHGLAGSAPVALLALAAMPSPAAAALYLAVFALGTTLGMVLFSLLLAAPVASLAPGARLRRRLAAATGLAAIAVGAWLLWQTALRLAP